MTLKELCYGNWFCIDQNTETIFFKPVKDQHTDMLEVQCLHVAGQMIIGKTILKSDTEIIPIKIDKIEINKI